MRWKPLTNSSAALASVLGAVALATASAGCAHAINPFADEGAPPEDMTTASERTIRDHRAAPVVRQREWGTSATTYPSGRVVHWPTWFEDPFEDKGSDDGKFAWTAEDYLAIPYSFARLLLNTIGWPVSAVVTPPGTPMASDGKLSQQILGKDHDATRLGRSREPSPIDDTTRTDPTKSGQLADQIDPDDVPVGPPYVEQTSFQE